MLYKIRLPIFWRHLLSTYIKFFSISIASFISIILLISLKEISQLIALGSSFKDTLLFTLYQIPHIFPLTIPISVLISSIFLVFKLNQFKELVALRSSGLSMKVIFTPILFFSLFLSLINFYITSELTTFCRQKTKEMLFENTTKNPLILLQRQNLIKIKDLSISMDLEKGDKQANNLVMAAFNPHNNRIELITAKSITYTDSQLLGSDISSIFYLNEKEPSFPTLIIENQKQVTTSAQSLSKVLKKNHLKDNSKALLLSHLLIRLKTDPQQMDYVVTEILRRISLGFFAFSFCLIGLSTLPKPKPLFYSISLVILALILFLTTKHFKSPYFVSAFLYLLPHGILISYSIFNLKKIEKGYQ